MRICDPATASVVSANLHAGTPPAWAARIAPSAALSATTAAAGAGWISLATPTIDLIGRASSCGPAATSDTAVVAEREPHVGVWVVPGGHAAKDRRPTLALR